MNQNSMLYNDFNMRADGPLIHDQLGNNDRFMTQGL